MPDKILGGRVAFATLDEPDHTGPERRRSPRFRCEGFAEVQLLERDTMFRGEVRNLSLHGCFVATRARVNLNRYSPVLLRISLRNRIYRTQGIAMNIRPGEGIGFAFHHPDAKALDDFTRLVEDYSNAGVREE